jgi:hypothetical protein
MLSFEQKRTIFSSFPELKETEISHGRVNYEYSASKKSRKVLARELHPSGNGYVCGEYINGYDVDPRGWVKIKDFNEEALRTIIKEAIESMSRP